MQVLSRKLELTDGGYPFAQFHSRTSPVLDNLASQPWFIGTISKQDLARIANGEGVPSDKFKNIICKQMNIPPITAVLAKETLALVELTSVMLNIIEYADFEKAFNVRDPLNLALEDLRDFISVMDESISKDANNPLRVRFNSFVGKIHITSLNETSAAVQVARLLSDNLVGGIPHEGATLNLLTDLTVILTSHEAEKLKTSSDPLDKSRMGWLQKDLKDVLEYLSTASAMSNKQIARAFLEMFSLVDKMLTEEHILEYRDLMEYDIAYLVDRAPVNEPDFAMEYLAAIERISPVQQDHILHKGRLRFCLEDRDVAGYVLKLMKPMQVHYPGSHLRPSDPIVAILGKKIDFTDEGLKERFLTYIAPFNEGTKFKIWDQMLRNPKLPNDLKAQIAKEAEETVSYEVIKKLNREKTKS